jgi:serine/threonine-protein kinase TNNI3K
LKYLHSLKPLIIHRDLRSYNIFITSLEIPNNNNNEIVNAKIGDFGLSIQNTLLPLREALESWQWLAPEVIIGNSYNESSDIYSFGKRR